MSDLTVRDHSKPCRHYPAPEGHELTTPIAWLDGEIWRCEWCPGGREIVLREASFEDAMLATVGTVYVLVEEA